MPYHLLTDRCGIPLAVGLSAANTHDPKLLSPWSTPFQGPARPGRPAPQAPPPRCIATRAMTTSAAGGRCAAAGITPRITRRGVEPSDRLGRHRYVVGRVLAWLVGYRRLQVRYERHADILLAFLYLACFAVIRWAPAGKPSHIEPQDPAVRQVDLRSLWSRARRRGRR
jgi:hypothetical protein